MWRRTGHTRPRALRHSLPRLRESISHICTPCLTSCPLWRTLLIVVKRQPERKPSESEQHVFWSAVFCAALQALIIRHNGKRTGPYGLVRLAGEYADAAIELERERVTVRRSTR